MKVRTVKIENFKSIRDLPHFELRDINVLIGANGAGKSNFISYFKFLQQVMDDKLEAYVAQKGGATNFLFFGRKPLKNLILEIVFENDGLFDQYMLSLMPTDDNRFYFEMERSEGVNTIFHKGFFSRESHTLDTSKIRYLLKSYKIYHFHDVSDTAYLKGACNINDNRQLREDASNLPAFLYYLQQRFPVNFRRIEKIIRQVAPFFDRFDLQPLANTPDQIMLEWREIGTDKYFNARHLSDGTLRMICLATLFLQPEPPQMIIIDEPELGLHPAALNILGGIIRSAAHQSQIIISTQSVTFINNFQPEDLIVVERKDGQSTFKRLDAEKLEEWMEEYTVGEIWEKNIIGGRP